MSKLSTFANPTLTPRRWSRAVVPLLALGAASWVWSCTPSTSADVALTPIACEELATSLFDSHPELEGTQFQRVEAVAAGQLQLSAETEPLADAPALCRVAGVIEPTVRFEVWLPDDWNGRLQVVGNGGMAGTISFRSMIPALARGSATASTDTCHPSEGRPFDASWAAGRPDLTADFGHRALHLTTVAAKTLVQGHYGRSADHSYYTGCSKGGQQGLMEAQRYPDDFDGILAGNPANDWTSFYAGAHLWYSIATLKDEESYIEPEKAQLLGDAVNEACDELDGIRDGVLDDPRQCSFDPAQLQCVGKAGDDCLTAPQVQAVREIWSGVRTSDGEVVFPGLVPGGEGAPGGWARWVTGPEPFRSLHWLAAEGFFRHMVFNEPDWDFRSFDFDRDLPRALEAVGEALDADDPDLSPFRDRGGKLLVYHGWSDADISPLGSIDYYEQVVRTLSGQSVNEDTLAETSEFFRLFMVPGMGHCSGGPGPNRFDALSALERWVEDGEVPQRIVATRSNDDGLVERSRPLCPYPQVARYLGEGSLDEAESFVCAAPGP